MKVVPVREAVGMMLGHDLTRIVPGEGKGAAFRRGHVIGPEDVELLLSMGKEHIYALEIPAGMVHEEEAALRIARATAGGGVELQGPREGKVDLKAAHHGLLRVDVERLRRLNAVGEVQYATGRDRTPVRQGQTVAGTRVTPLLVDEGQVADAEQIGREGGPVVDVLPVRPHKCGLIVTGSEVYKGRIPDRFGPVVQAKLEAWGCSVVYRDASDDDTERTAGKIAAALAAGAELICCTGGMSVDPDDATPGAIRRSGARVVTYGAPVLPGSMVMLAYHGSVPIFGLPGAVMHDPVTIFDFLLARVLAGERLSKADFIEMGHGGLLSLRGAP